MPTDGIPFDAEEITPQMLPLVSLDVGQIERIVRAVPGGVTNIQDIYPLAPSQESLLLHHLQNERSCNRYVSSTLLSFESRNKLEEFVEIMARVILLHDVLRTAVLWECLPRPVQVVYRRAILPVREIVLAPNREIGEQLQGLIGPGRQTFDLRRAPLMRLYFAGDPRSTQWYALLEVHDLICDNEARSRLRAEIVANFRGQVEGLPRGSTYRNHVAQVLAYARSTDGENFFRGKLGDVEEPTAPFGFLDVTEDCSQIEEVRKRLEPVLSQRLRTQVRRLEVTAATIFHAAWALVVAHTSGRDDVLFGSAFLGRLQGSTDAQQVLGMFTNALPLRLRLKGVTAKELVEQTQRELMDLLSHQQVSLGVARRCSGISGSTPLFSALLSYRHSVPNPQAEWDSVNGIRVLMDQARTDYPIVLCVDDLEEEFTLTAQTDRRIDPNRIVGYTRAALYSLIDGLETAPQIPALSLSILPEDERRQVIELFNATKREYPRERLIHELFEEQVERTPHAVAVVYARESLTYAELNGRANQLARYLREKGVGPDQLVGICVERSLEMVVGLLGVLKAGGAYVPLDPGYPQERLAHVLEDAAPRVLLTQDRLESALPQAAAETLTLDGDWDAISERECGNLDFWPDQLASHNLAYVIYTSGSTGKPKGVMVRQSSVVNFLTSMQQRPGIGTQDCLLAVTTVSFDIAGLEIYLPLISGARMLLVSRDAASDARELIKMIEASDVTVLQATPATWKMLLNAGWEGRSKLMALCGGEALTADLSEKLQARVGTLWNLYGPTETTIWSCVQKIIASGETGAVESIGHPIANTQIYILDAYRQLLPIGVAGEVYIGGAGVARGYWNRPELTAERFIADPFSADPRARLYKTGDLGRWRPDGAIEYLGRNDHQVKIRGFRIELGEIEAQLRRHVQVEEAVVIAREDVPGEKRLVAYVIGAHPTVAPSVQGLRTHLKGALPDFMVPSAFVVLDKFPLTPNGKLDRQALPAPDLSGAVSREYEEAQGEVEEILVGIWQGLLGVERVGRWDNFFELGGQSLLATRVIAHASEVFDMDISVRLIFEHPTIASLSDYILKEIQAELAMEAL